MFKLFLAVWLLFVPLYSQAIVQPDDTPIQVQLITEGPPLPNDFPKGWGLFALESCSLSRVDDFLSVTHIKDLGSAGFILLTQIYLNERVLFQGIAEYTDNGTITQGTTHESINGIWVSRKTVGTTETKALVQSQMWGWRPTVDEQFYCSRTSSRTSTQSQ